MNVRSINEIDINIYDENNNYIDFNNLDWTMTLVISSEINFDELLNISWDSIRIQQQQKLIDEMNKRHELNKKAKEDFWATEIGEQRKKQEKEFDIQLTNDRKKFEIITKKLESPLNYGNFIFYIKL